MPLLKNEAYIVQTMALAVIGVDVQNLERLSGQDLKGVYLPLHIDCSRTAIHSPSF